MAYHSQKNGQAERFSPTIETWLQHYVSDHHLDWDWFVLPLTYVYYTQMYHSTSTSPCSLVHSHQPPGPSLLISTTDRAPSAKSIFSTQLMRQLIQNRIVTLPIKVNVNLRKSQTRYELRYDRRLRKIPSFTPGAYVSIEKLTWRIVPDTSGEAMVKHTYNKVQAGTSGPYRINMCPRKKYYDRRQRRSPNLINRPRRTFAFFFYTI